ncbi:plant UBX domain-containing protein 8 [Quillaja saponaria]|uniref:Plant UBX domain-containing protein 8 n=1 Tax=Quillaja saponaria TaxID=32244 RepID=A0AAD7L6A4_QUISA|nr:plant UBX domain-containing protein 8 [Quillaja saponaria]
MARPNQVAIETFMSITGASEAIAVQKLEEHGGDLNEAVNVHFSEGNISVPASVHATSTAVPQDDFMNIDDPLHADVRGPLSVLSAARNLNPYSLLDPSSNRSLLESRSDFTNQAPFVTPPRQVREIPIEVKDGNPSTAEPGHAPNIEDVTGTADAHGPDVHGTVIIDDEEDDDISDAPTAHQNVQNENVFGDGSLDRNSRLTPPEFENLQDVSNDIEEEMIRAAIEASKREVEVPNPNQQFGTQNNLNGPVPQQNQSHLEDPELAHAVSLSLKTAEQEKVLRELEGDVGSSKVGPSEPSEVEMSKIVTGNGRLEPGSSSIQDEAEDAEEQPLVRHRSRRVSSGSGDSAKDVGLIEANAQSSTGQHASSIPQQNANSFPSDEWGGISSEEHDEAVMLEAAMFGGIPEGNRYFGYAPHQFMQPPEGYPRPTPRPPSPSLTAQRLIREQQDDEYFASLQADREKELKAMEEAEAAREEERRREEEFHRKVLEEQELERQLAAKEVSLPQEPSADDENAVTLLVRMPDGSRRGRRFLKSDNLQSLFDFIDIGRVVKPGTYRLVRPYPRRAFSDGESALTLNELGLTSKQEALFLELI